MFYQCGKCQAIYEIESKANKCCKPSIFILKHEEVQTCVYHDPLAAVCYKCRGTGLVKRNPDLKEIITSR